MKIICIEQNYPSHNKEAEQAFTNKVEPVVFLKPDTAIIKDNKPFFIPDFSEEIHCQAEIVVKIDRLGKNIAPRFAHRYYKDITLGINFTAIDLQEQLVAAGKPWDLAKAFDRSAALGRFISVEDVGRELNKLPFCLKQNKQEVQAGNTCEMLSSIDELISYVSGFFTLKIGDLLFTGSPGTSKKVQVNDLLTGYIGEDEIFSFNVK